MKASELIRALSMCNPNLEVSYYWDGEPRSYVKIVWIEDGEVVLAEELECYDRNRIERVNGVLISNESKP